ncbi:hypothetical protein [Flammeovirga aprica]|uniref:Uncharacterized protein n=1 Tax=Flammeovirga aprica JL-4 TaxID=694437 RepID=A0A7X9P0S9_9BACT|nr:hypothetical protein [Flammeovirga aprica]NME67449.1 hypothetical protein [Flammeovirga aprica JL-4]
MRIKEQFILFLFVFFLYNIAMAQEIVQFESGKKISYREEEWMEPFVTIPYLKLSPNSREFDTLQSIYFSDVVHNDSIYIFGKINPQLYISALPEGYCAISLNEENEIMDVKSLSYYSNPDCDEKISTVVNDTTLSVIFLDGYKRRLEKYTLVQRDHYFVKKDSRVIKTFSSFEEWELFYFHYED